MVSLTEIARGGGVHTFSGKGIGSIVDFFVGSDESSCLILLAATGDEGSSLALRLPAIK